MRIFLIIWAGQFASLTGSRLSGFALGVWVFQQTGSATQFALISLFALLPGVLVGPFAGAIADRYDRRVIAMLGDSGAAVCTLVNALLFFGGRLDIGLIYLLQSLAALCSAFQVPAYQASITTLVPKEQLPRAIGMGQLADGLSLVLAAPLAGLLFAPLGLGGIFILDLLTFLLAVGCLLAVRFPQIDGRSHRQSGRGALLRETGEVVGYLLARPGLVGMVLIGTMMNFAIGMVSALLNPMLLSYASSTATGLVNGALGLGSVAGSLLMSVWKGPRPRIYGFLGFGAINGLATMLAGLRPDAWLTGAALFVAFAGLPVAVVCSSVIWRSKVPVSMQGRVLALNRMVATASLPLAFVLAGPLADRVFEPLLQAGGGLAGSVGMIIGVGPGRGIGLLFIITGLFMACSALVGLLFRSVREVEDLPESLEHETTEAGGTLERKARM
jgi:MFS transporter, DHA3 family, macrolide efflux protein